MTRFAKKLIKLFAAIVITLTVILIAFFVFLHFSFKDLCVNEIYQTVLSPNKKLKAVVFQRNCGATTGFSTQISIIPENKELANESGNIFTADGHPGDSPKRVTWINDTTLEIQENFAKSYLREKTFKEIRVKYTK